MYFINFCQPFSIWYRGVVVCTLDFETGDCEFEPHLGQTFLFHHFCCFSFIQYFLTFNSLWALLENFVRKLYRCKKQLKNVVLTSKSSLAPIIHVSKSLTKNVKLYKYLPWIHFIKTVFFDVSCSNYPHQ